MIGPVSTYQIALLLHVFGVIVMIGGIIAAGLAYYAARRRERPSEVAATLLLSRSGVLVGAAGFALTTGFGLWLVHVARHSYTEPWLVAVYALYGASNVLGGATGRVPKRARLLAERLAAAEDRPTDELRRLLHHRPSELLNHVSSLLMLAVLVLMVWRPGS
jgi:uncharacterized membrane protein